MSASGQSAGTPFAPLAVAVMISVALVGFISYLLLSAYAPDFRPAKSGGEHALSPAAVGFRGVTDLLRMTNRDVVLVRRKQDLTTPDLLVVTPGSSTDVDAVQKILQLRSGLPTLIVLPKWVVQPTLFNPAWVRSVGPIPTGAVSDWLKAITPATIVEAPPHGFRTIAGPKLSTTMFQAPGGGTLVAGIDDTATFVLADPDALDNLGLDKAAGAEQAVALLDKMTPAGKGVAFDMTLYGFGGNPSLLKLAFEAPFLPLTLCIVFAALLAGWHGLWRFGPAAHEGRKVAFGKRAIVENGASLLRLAGRRHRTGERYATLTRDAAASATGAPVALHGEALDRYLDRLSSEDEPFTSIAERAASAPDTRRLLAAARDLYHWKRTVTGEH